MSNSLLEIENLTIRFHDDDEVIEAVNNVSFKIAKGEIYGLVGESGSGKTVTAWSIMQLLDSEAKVTADKIMFNGQDLLSRDSKDIQAIRGGEIAMIFQDSMNSLNPIMTVGEQIAETARHHEEIGESRSFLAEMRRKYITGVSEASASWQRAISLLEDVGISEPVKRAREYPHQLSGGMRQRVMIAQALAGSPSLIIADEPTTALDVIIENQILNELIDIADRHNVSVLLITHDLAVVKNICDRVGVIYAGEMMEKAETSKLFSNPRNPYTQRLLETIPRITDQQQRLDIIEGVIPNPRDKPPGCPFQDRCPKAFEMCDEPLESYKVDGHTVRCHLYHPQVQNDAEEEEMNL